MFHFMFYFTCDRSLHDKCRRHQTAEFRFLWVIHVEQSAMCSAQQQPVTEPVQEEVKDIFFRTVSSEAELDAGQFLVSTRPGPKPVWR